MFKLCGTDHKAMDIERNLCAGGAVLVIFNVLTLSP